MRWMMVLSLVGCASTSAPIEGGGTRGAPGEHLEVHVVDADGAPIEGARVDEARTGADGFVRLSARDVVRVEAEGFRAERWVGFEAAALTVPLRTLTTPPTATVEVSVPGAADRVHVGLAGPLALDAAALPVPCDGGCELTVPAGEITIFAQLETLDGEEVTPSGFAIAEPITLAPGERGAARLEESAAVREVEVVAPAPPAGLDAVVGVPGVSVDGRLLLFAPGARRFVVPDLEGAGLWAVATATSDDARSRSVVRGGDGALAPPSLRAPPTLDASGALGGIDGADLVSVETPAERILVFDGRVIVEPPSGEVTVIATEAPRSDDGWRLREVEERWTRRASRRLRL